MNEAKSLKVVSSQTEPHKNLRDTVLRYLNTSFKQEIPQYAKDAFVLAADFVKERQANIILDSGCGTGESTLRLAKMFPESVVIGVDKSVNRLNRNRRLAEAYPNLMLIRCDCIHFWRLAKRANWRLSQHYLLYPNPWPKPGHLQRRWHGHPIFPDMLGLYGKLVLRTNWEIYAHEFALACEWVTGKKQEVSKLDVVEPITPFERKYVNSEHELYETIAEL